MNRVKWTKYQILVWLKLNWSCAWWATIASQYSSSCTYAFRICSAEESQPFCQAIAIHVPSVSHVYLRSKNWHFTKTAINSRCNGDILRRWHHHSPTLEGVSGNRLWEQAARALLQIYHGHLRSSRVELLHSVLYAAMPQIYIALSIDNKRERVLV